jgi:hypothetical protein
MTKKKVEHLVSDVAKKKQRKEFVHLFKASIILNKLN